MPGNPLQIGCPVGSKAPVILSAKARDSHVYICGGTGVGKSKFLESCIKQDIYNWRNSRCGLILFDPHGLVYQNTMKWLADYQLKRPIVPIELRRDDWIISYNLLRKREADPAVIVSNFVRALSHVWGEGGTDSTPLFARWASIILLTIYQNGYTVSDIMHLLSRADIRQGMTTILTDPTARQAWDFAKRHPKEFEQQITSTLNRFNRLSGPKVMKASLGQSDVSLDLLTALNEGQIILVDLSTKGGLIDREDADTYATLLLSDLWASAEARGKGEREAVKPFYVYIDECQDFVTPTIAKNLAQSRGFGLHLTLANQQPSQFLDAGPHGKALYNAVLGIAGTNIAFRVKHPEDGKVLAQQLFMNTFDTDEVKLDTMSTKVVGYKEEIRESRTIGTSETHSSGSGRGGGKFHGESQGEGSGHAETFDPANPDPQENLSVESWNNSIASAAGESESWSENESDAHGKNQSSTYASVLIPILGQERSSRQFRPIEEQIFRSMQKLFDQEDRHFVIRYPGGPKAPLFVKTPTVKPTNIRTERVESYRQRLLEKLPFALRMIVAEKNLAGREQKLLSDLVNIANPDEPTPTGRRIK